MSCVENSPVVFGLRQSGFRVRIQFTHSTPHTIGTFLTLHTTPRGCRRPLAVHTQTPNARTHGHRPKLILDKLLRYFGSTMRVCVSFAGRPRCDEDCICLLRYTHTHTAHTITNRPARQGKSYIRILLSAIARRLISESRSVRLWKAMLVDCDDDAPRQWYSYYHTCAVWRHVNVCASARARGI